MFGVGVGLLANPANLYVRSPLQVACLLFWYEKNNSRMTTLVSARFSDLSKNGIGLRKTQPCRMHR